MPVECQNNINSSDLRSQLEEDRFNGINPTSGFHRKLVIILSHKNIDPKMIDYGFNYYYNRGEILQFSTTEFYVKFRLRLVDDH